MKKKNKVLKIKSPKGLPIPKSNEFSIKQNVDSWRRKKDSMPLDKLNLKAIEAGHKKFLRDRHHLW